MFVEDNGGSSINLVLCIARRLWCHRSVAASAASAASAAADMAHARGIALYAVFVVVVDPAICCVVLATILHAPTVRLTALMFLDKHKYNNNCMIIIIAMRCSCG